MAIFGQKLDLTDSFKLEQWNETTKVILLFIYNQLNEYSPLKNVTMISFINVWHRTVTKIFI